jgi:NADH:ubiquinone oxidoreductase subunit K
MSAEILLLAMGLILTVAGAYTGAGLAATAVGIGLVVLALAMQHGRLR